MDNLEKIKNGVAQSDYGISDTEISSLKYKYDSAIKLVDDIVLKNYITKLSDMDVIPLDKNILKNNIDDNVLFFKITEMVYEKDEFATYKFASVFNSLSTTESSIFIIIDSNGEKTDFYMGIRSFDENRTTSSIKNTIKNALKGQFSGIKTIDYTIEEMKGIISGFKVNNISSASCVANIKSQDIKTNNSFLQGLEKLVLSMQGEKYTGIILANATNKNQIIELRKGYENIYTQLSAFSNRQINYTNNNSFSSSFSETDGTNKSKTHTKNSSETIGESNTIGTSESHGTSQENFSGKAIKAIAGTASILGGTLFGAGIPMAGLVAGGLIGGGVSLLGSIMSKTETDTFSRSESNTKNFSNTTGISDGVTEGVNHSKTQGTSYTDGTSKGLTLNLRDKSVENVLERINKQLKRIENFESFGMYECSAYFLSEEQAVAESAASTYKSLMSGENSGVEVSAINSWGRHEKDKTKQVSEYITNFIHPVFKYEHGYYNMEVTPCSFISGNELAVHMGLPRRSVCGLPVIEHADFGKEVVTYDLEKKSSSINLGNIFNMGSVYNNNVKLDINSLSMHTFITGSTGSGKSNTVYEIIRQLENVDINYMIIEPTKGEYKNVFGNSKRTKVLGTNPKYTDILRINPFKFPKGIHILEHIDRLVEIFNVCWPMYAAMPAILKDALLQSYEVCGWSLDESKNIYSDELFPTFQDLLNELVNVIQSSQYSEEVKSNYMGSLITRVKSLTNGLNGKIFSAKEIDNEILFDRNVIVDLSRVGSLETKSLIMGILIMRLNEHRMSNTNSMNEQLKHVTVIEEAHNILKRTSTEQNSESSNILGKSVEMLSNAIAEMRTYGEGFIIIDQSPTSLDASAIKNTNTKIIMRLPDEQDRRISGKSAGLKDEQLDEISKLPKGVAVVYQNNWLEAVLCKVKKFSRKEERYNYINTNEEIDITKEFKSRILEFLLNNRVNNKIDNDIDNILYLMNNADISLKQKLYLINIIDNYKKKNELFLWDDDKFYELSKIVSEIICFENKTKYIIDKSQDLDELTLKLMEYIESNTQNLSKEFKLAIAQCLMKVESMDESKFDIYSAWITDLKNKGIF